MLAQIGVQPAQKSNSSRLQIKLDPIGLDGVHQPSTRLAVRVLDIVRHHLDVPGKYGSIEVEENRSEVRRSSASKFSIFDSFRNERIGAKTPLFVLFIIVIVALEPNHIGFAFKG